MAVKRKIVEDDPSRKTRKLNEPEEEWGGIGGIAENVAEEIASAYAARTGTKPIKPPTGEELREIKDAADLFRSSSFKLQIDAILPNVRPKPSRVPPLDRFLLALHPIIMALPSVPPQHPLEASRNLLSKKAIAVPYPFPLPTEDTNWKVAFEPPSDITLVGSWANKTAIKAKDSCKFGVDLAVEMPASLFQEKDYLNGRFFHKKAFYLATIAAALKKSKKLNVELAYESMANDPRMTVLLITPTKNNSTNDFTTLNAHIRIIPVLPSTSPIPLHRLSPAHSNIRITTSDNTTETTHPATPLYNTALLTSLTPKNYLLHTHTLQSNVPSFTDAVTLLRTWANQRGYGVSGQQGLSVLGFDGKGPWWSALLGVLIDGEEIVGSRIVVGKSKRKGLGRGLSSWQLFKAALDFLASHDFKKTPIYMRSKDGHRFRPEEYESAHEAVFVDSTSTVNLLAGVPLTSLDMLRYDAKKTLEILDHTPISRDPFKEVFLREQRDLATRFDTVIRVDLASPKSPPNSLQSTLDHGSPTRAVLSHLASILRPGLSDRTAAIAILHPTPTSRPLTLSHPSSSSPFIIHIGLIHDETHAYRLVDHGPPADEEDQTLVQKFKDFWGTKAELRRFRDGKIGESVVWDVKDEDGRKSVPAMVVRHLLKQHFGVEDTDEEPSVTTWQAPFDALLKVPEPVSRVYVASKSPAGFKSAIGALDSVVKAIKALDAELPLSILSVSPISSSLRYTSVFAPVPLTETLARMMPESVRYLPTMDIIIEFEKSSRWPDELKAIQKIKLAFFERVAEVLMAGVNGLRAGVVVPSSQESEIIDSARLELVTKEGWAFSLRIWHEREAVLLDRIIESKSKLMAHIATKQDEKEKGKGKGKEYYEAVEARQVYDRRFIHAPRHHRAIAALCHLHGAFPGTVRLVKRWLAAHWLLGTHISEEAVEIICANFFVGDGRVIAEDEETVNVNVNVPGSKERGFALVVDFLREWTWEDGLFVPLYGSTGTIDSSNSSVLPAPPGLKAGVWTVSTEQDREGRIWTTQGPDVMIAHRVRALAKATWELLSGMHTGQLDVKALFTHPTQDYDFIIQLDPAVLPRYYQNINADHSLLDRGKFANLKGETGQLRPEFDPAQYLLDDLKRVYTDTFKIFHDLLGGDRFGAVWDPTLAQARPFRVMGGFSSVPVKKENEKSKEKGLVVLNKAGVLSEIERLGAGLIKEIIVQHSEDA